VRWAERGGNEKWYKSLIENLKGKDHLEDLCGDGRLILKYILEQVCPSFLLCGQLRQNLVCMRATRSLIH